MIDYQLLFEAERDRRVAAERQARRLLRRVDELLEQNAGVSTGVPSLNDQTEDGRVG